MKALASLAAIGALCAGLLAGTQALTGDAIRANREAAAWRVAFEIAGGPFPTARLRWRNDELSLPNGYRLQRTQVAGYAGPIELLVAFPPAAQGSAPAGVRVTNHRETPGLGDFIDAARSPWILQFSERPPDAVDAVTGATITSGAVKRGVSALLQSVEQPAPHSAAPRHTHSAQAKSPLANPYKHHQVGDADRRLRWSIHARRGNAP